MLARLLVVMILFCNTVAYAADPAKPLTLPKELKFDKAPVLLVVEAKTEGKKVAWRDGGKFAQVVSVDFLRDSKVYVALITANGKYTLTGATAINEEPVLEDVVITVGDGKPDDVAPPGPDVPVDFLTALKTSYKSEADDDKEFQLEGLKLVYGVGRQALISKDVKTYADLVAKMAEAAGKYGVAGKLSTLQNVVSTELKKSGFKGKTDELIGDPKKLRESFTKVLAALESVN